MKSLKTLSTLLVLSLSSFQTHAAQKCSDLFPGPSSGDLVSVKVRDPYGGNSNLVVQRAGAFQRIEKGVVYFEGFSVPHKLIKGEFTVARSGDLVSVSVRNPYGNDNSYVIQKAGIYKKTEGKVIEFEGFSLPESLLEGSMTIAKSGNLVSFSVRNPHGGNPNHVVEKVGVFQKIEQQILFLEGFSVPQRLLEGPMMIVMPGQTVSFTIRNPFGNDPNYTIQRSGVFQKVEGGVIYFDGFTVPQNLLEGPISAGPRS